MFNTQIDRGIRLLDERIGPDWINKIDLGELKMSHGCHCVLGQLGKPNGMGFWDMVEDLRIEDRGDYGAKYGFYIGLGKEERCWYQLKIEWTEAILALREVRAMEIGKEQPVTTIEPVEDPVHKDPAPEPEVAPLAVPEAEPVPA